LDSLDDRESDIPTRTLIESMIREDATIDAGELYDVANGLSMTDQQVRLCIKRLTVEGRFTTAAELGVADHVMTLTTSDLTIGTITEPRELAEHLWPIERITEEHRRLLAVAERYLPALRRASHTEQLTIAIGLAAEFDRAMA
jgi:DNA-binding transcriptional regulator PaaX